MATEAIDVFCHCMPSRYVEAVNESVAELPVMFQRAQRMPVMVDLAARLRVMDEFPGYRQIVSLPGPPVEVLALEHAAGLCQIANDALAGEVEASGGRLCGFAAALPMNDPAKACAEARRAVGNLGAVAAQVYTSVGGKPLDDPQFEPVFQTLGELDCPVLLHPTRSILMPDYPSESISKFDLWWAIGWPYETTLAMARLAMSGLFERLPTIKVIAHHVGGYLPMLSGRLGPGMELLGTRNPPGAENLPQPQLAEPPAEACRRFYADTASFGSRGAIECGLEFFGAERLLFATDMPFDPQQGPCYIRSTLAAIDNMNLTESHRAAILAGNARRLFKLPDDSSHSAERGRRS